MVYCRVGRVPGLVYTLVQRCFAASVLLMVLVKLYRAKARKHGAGFACCLLALLAAILCTVSFFLFRNPVRDIAGGLATESTELEYVQFDTDSGEYSVFYKIEGKDSEGNYQSFCINRKTLERYEANNQRYGTAKFQVQYYAHTEIVTGLTQTA